MNLKSIVMSYTNIRIFKHLAVLSAFFMVKCNTGVQNNQRNATLEEKILVVSYNVENLFDTTDDPLIHDNEFLPQSKKQWTKERYNKKLTDISGVLCNIDTITTPGIIGLCEVENKQVLVDLLEQSCFSAHDYGIVHENSPDERGIDVALLYKKDIFTYIEHSQIKIDFADDPEMKVRNILCVTGTLPGNDTIRIFVNHWKSRYGGMEETEPRRVYTAQLLRKAVDSLLQQNIDASILIMGDMNDEPENKSLSQTLNATNNETNPSSKELYNLMYNKDLKNEGSYNYKGNWNMLDNLIVSQGLLNGKTHFIKPDEGLIYKAEYILYKNPETGEVSPNRTYGGSNYYGGYSDHLPVYTYLRKK